MKVVLTQLAAAALVLFNLGAQAQAAPIALDRLEASVNSSLILLSDIRKFRDTEKLRSQIDPLFAGTNVATKGKGASDEDITDFLINEKLISQAFPVTDAEAETEVNAIQSNNKIARESLKKALSEQGFSFDDYFELIRASSSKRNLIDRDIRTKVTISDDDVKNYFYNHYAKSTGAPVQYQLQVVTITIKNYKSQGAAKETADRALKEIKSGEAFEEVAKRVSDDASAASGGDIGTLGDDMMAPALRDQAKKLQIGEVSDVFPASNGYYILKLLDKKSGDTERLAKMREEIRGQLAATEYAHQIALWLERQRQTAFVHRVGEAAALAVPTGK